MPVTNARVPKLDLFDKFRDIVPCVSLDGFTAVIDAGGSAIPWGAAIDLKTGEISGYTTGIAQTGLYELIAETGKLVKVEFIIVFLSSVALVTAHLSMHEYANMPVGAETQNHFGFKLVNADLYAINGNGTAQTSTDTGVDLALGDQLTRLRVELNRGTDCKFYVNGVLKVTHTTNLPIVTDFRLLRYITTNTAALKELEVGRVLIEKEY